VARLKRLEAEKRKKKAQAEQLKRQQTWQQQQKAKREQMLAQRRARLVAQCEAAHETDCENPVFLRKWFRKKYSTK
jgi:hypothetical protein